jgi:hypothetical protein
MFFRTVGHRMTASGQVFTNAGRGMAGSEQRYHTDQGQNSQGNRKRLTHCFILRVSLASFKKASPEKLPPPVDAPATIPAGRQQEVRQSRTK